MAEFFKNILPRFAILFCAIAIVLVSLSACNAENNEVPDIILSTDADRPTSTNKETSTGRPTNTESKMLVVYFSQPDNVDNSSVVIDGQTLGNTQYMAYVIQENTGANIFRIVPETPYPTDHDALVDLARDEQRNGARPAFVGEIENFDEYDTVFVGYPNWWSDMPMIIYTFFDTYDFSGKTIIPFNTHGGSGFSDTISAIRRSEPDAKVLNGLSISRNHIQDAEQEIAEWVRSLGFEKNS